MKTDDYYEIKEHEPLDNDCICGSCCKELLDIFVRGKPDDSIS